MNKEDLIKEEAHSEASLAICRKEMDIAISRCRQQGVGLMDLASMLLMDGTRGALTSFLRSDPKGDWERLLHDLTDQAIEAHKQLRTVEMIQEEFRRRGNG
jgi:hypothetical protein